MGGESSDRSEDHGGHTSGERLYPLWQYIGLKAWDLVTWPYTVRQLKRAGFRHTGFMTWETGPDDGRPHG